MRLLQLRDVEITPNDRVFRYSRLHAIAFVMAAISGVAWLFIRAHTAGWKPGYYFAVAVLLLILPMRRFITARFRPSNWLVQANNTGFYVHFRSYLNYHLPADDPTVVYLDYSEVCSARLVKERLTTPEPGSRRSQTQTRYLRHVELELVGGTGPLTKALQDELTAKAPKERRWYGSSATLYQDHPVRIVAQGCLRLRWAVVPGTDRFLDLLREYVPILEPVSLTRDFSHLESVSRDEQQKHLRELVRRGETIAAVYIARKLYGCGLAEAKQLVESLRAQAEDRTLTDNNAKR